VLGSAPCYPPYFQVVQIDKSRWGRTLL
jgi:hypothetical protein